ncbi:hypothetical protein TNCT_130411 [Trichonephila clavata]|uniref:Uncharacterized protein n=1 Tax=Trichonephila clavata TaxID=2740835 RepID=A0A8X6GAT2_TRICU|nr:hypothetical protein TNCT_130411 [Trichonephila clavata]
MIHICHKRWRRVVLLSIFTRSERERERQKLIKISYDLHTKREPTSVIEEKGDHTIEELITQTPNLAITYIDGSSDSILIEEMQVSSFSPSREREVP